MYKLVCLSTEDPWARSSRAAHVPQAAQPYGMGLCLGHSSCWQAGVAVTGRLSILLMWLCCFQGFSSRHCGRERGSWVISLTQHWLVLICLNCSLIQVSELSMAHLCSGALELLGLSEISHPGGALDTWALSAQCTVWVLGCSQCLFSSMNDSSEGLCAL